MSHVTTLELAVDDLNALEEACQLLGLELMRGQKTYKWYGTWMQDYDTADAAFRNGIKPEDYGKCEHALRVKGNNESYEVGIVRRADGTLGIIYDLWAGGRGLEAAIGRGATKLREEYSLAVAMAKTRRKGFRVQRRINQETGRPQMYASRRT